MLFNRNTPPEKPAFQRQLDAEAARWRWSRELQHQTDAAFEPDEIHTFRMTGLYGQIPGADPAPVRLRPAS